MIAFNNLYSNAVKYSYTGMAKKERYITTECDEEILGGQKYFSMDVSNFGVGILQDEIDSEKIYIPGYRGILSLDRNRTGSGVGLYLIREVIVRIHNGKIEIVSENKESGYLTTVKVMIPFP